jgi:SAM domain (Sterile alpha motif)
MDVFALLRDLGLPQYEAAFRENAIDAEVLPRLTGDDLEDIRVATITKDAYLTYVEVLFRLADTNGGGKLVGDELRLPAARKLERLLK